MMPLIRIEIIKQNKLNRASLAESIKKVFMEVLSINPQD